MSPPEPALADLRERVRAAAAGRTALRLRGAGTKDFYGETLAGEVLELGAHRGIVAYDPPELVVTARCGTRLSELDAALAAAGQFLPFEPPAFAGDPTLGGIVASGLSGPRRMYAGAARDFVLGARLLTAGGDVLRFGGEVMKNVAGFDVARLLCGSLGILGIITEVSLKVLPVPRQEETVRLELGYGEACARFAGWAARPLPVSAAAWHADSAWVRLSGAAPAVQAARAQIGGERIAPAEARQWWAQVRDQALAVFDAPEIWRLSLPGNVGPLPQLPVPQLIDGGGALRWYAADGPDFSAVATAVGGTALHWRSRRGRPRFHPLSPSVLALHRRLKERFDPAGIFNPGRLIAGL
ncbi:MAG: glycolate oxidase subunit GlcE [Proteobacteria bacterium]|nr:glycolate oxidase subunit GlcE [Pseudomonadota bacterium]